MIDYLESSGWSLSLEKKIQKITDIWVWIPNHKNKSTYVN